MTEHAVAEPFRRTNFEIQIHFLDSDITYHNEVVSLSATYAMNSIPVAMATIATGRDMITGKPSQIHDTVKNLRLREPVKIQIKIDTNTPDTGIGNMRGKWCTIFEGYFAGSGYQRTHESANYTLQFLHWLDDLACSSALNGRWHPGVPQDFAQAALGDIAEASNSDSGLNSPFVCIVDPTYAIVNKTNIENDLWGKVLRPLLTALAKKTVGTQSINNTTPNNEAAIKALEKITGDSPTPAELKINSTALADQIVAAAFVSAITQILKNGISYSSFWSKIIGEFGAEFLFGISPAATFANAVPYFGAINREWRTVTGAEYNYANFSNALVSLINSIEIRHPPYDTTGLTNGQTPINLTAFSFPLARYPMVGNETLPGQIVIKDPPAWMTAGFGTAALYSPSVLPTDGMGGPANINNPISSPTTPLQTVGSPLVQAYAEHLYKSEVLGQRRGELSGKLRFDIAPGSIIKIEAAETDISTVRVPLAANMDFYAMVTQVSFAINAETHMAGTSFALTNLRTEIENRDPNLTADAAPFYKATTWVGGPLVKEVLV